MNDEQLLRYSRQIMLPDFDYQGQQTLLESSVLIVGLGGLGCPVAMYLAAAGIGKLVLADFDAVELSNLQRQIAHGLDDVGVNKAVSAGAAIQQINPDVEIEIIEEKLTGELLEKAIAGVNLVVDATDNFAARFAINQQCVALKRPLVSGAAIRCEGQVIVFDSRKDDSPCYRCLYSDAMSEAQLSCSESGVLAPLVGVIGSFQALEAIRLLSNYGECEPGVLHLFDGKQSVWKRLQVSRDPDCPVCS